MNPHVGRGGQIRSIADVVTQLAREFDGVVPARAVTEVVKELSRNGAVSLPVLAAMARHELATGSAPDTHEQPRVDESGLDIGA